MSLLQRPPIDVNASIGCDRVLAIMEYAGDRLLNAADTIRPFAGAIIRNTLVEPLLDDLQKMPAEEREIVLAELDIFTPLDRAAKAHWEEAGQDRSITPGPVKYARMLRRAEGRKTIDQRVDPETGQPIASPLFGLLAIDGIIDVGSAVLRKYPSNPKAHPHFEPNQTYNPQRIHFSRLEAGDLWIGTTVPPTIRTFKPLTKDFLLAGVVGRFEPIKPVE